jgi:hypothetical protein
VQGWEARAWRDERARPRVDPSRRLATAVAALGLYLASAWLLVQHAGAEAMGLPLLPTVGFAFAALLTWSCVRKD